MTDIWHQLRKENIGGSDVAALFGHGYITKYKLWHEKKGNVEPDDLDNDPRVQAGQFLEAGVIAWANHRWGMNFYQPKVYVTHPFIKGMGCTPDAFSSGFDDVEKPTDRIAQIKTVDGLQFNMEWEADGELITHAPLHIMLQCQHEMACTGAKENWLIVLVGGNRLYRMVIERDEETIRIIEAAVKAFWLTIANDEEPTPDFSDDGDTIRKLCKRLKVIKETDLSDDDDLRDALEKLKVVMHNRKVSTDQEAYIKNKLIYCYGDEYERIRCGDITATIKADINGHIRVMIGSEKVSI